MAKHLSKEKWLEIKTKYQLGYGLSHLAKEFDLSPSTIHAKKEKEGWNQEAKEHVIELKKNISNIENSFVFEQLPFVQEEINEVLDLQRQVNTYIKQAVKLNQMNLHGIMSEPDLATRVRLTIQSRCTLPDLASISQTRPTITPASVDEEDKEDDSVIRFYLPERE